ncbi:uncharacterized protein C2orf50-like [Watersipora subatra]|uniref:uncharacterized protein C2orf50-like n=1 Tax=Watersipora subatra TaxID=2589382 RepID=UPI00355C86DE
MQREVSGVMFSYMNKSQHHETCIPSEKRRQPQLEPSSKPVAVLDYTKCDVVMEDKLWRQAVKNESNAVQKWKESWSFLLEYDGKGNPITPPELPEYESRFSSGPVPNTVSGVYGSRTTSPHAQQMFLMQQAFSVGNKKRKLDSEMVCY